MTSDVGLSTAYAYDGQGRLTQFTKPDNTSVSFEYNAQSLITAVKDYDSKILESHTYDAVGTRLDLIKGRRGRQRDRHLSLTFAQLL